MAPSHTARAARSRDADGDPQIVEQLPGRLNFKSNLSAFELQTKKIAKRFRLSDTLAAAVAEIAFNIGDAR